MTHPRTLALARLLPDGWRVRLDARTGDVVAVRGPVSVQGRDPEAVAAIVRRIAEVGW